MILLSYLTIIDQYVKANLINSVAVSKTKKFAGQLLDLNAGKGGDLPKWKKKREKIELFIHLFPTT